MFEEILTRLARTLDRAGIAYMVIGGQAVLLYGEPRLTKDIDLTVGAGLDRLDEMVDLVISAILRPLVDPMTSPAERWLFLASMRRVGFGST